MTNFVIISDLHCSDKPPASRTDDYLTSILTKVNWAVDYAITYNAFLIIAGDFCHHKKPKNISHFIVNRLIDILGKIGAKGVFAILGNHDIYSIKDDPQRAPITTLEKAGVLTLLGSRPHFINNTISLNGMDWCEAAETSPELLKLDHLNSKVRIGVYHQYIIPDGIKFAGEHTKLSKAHSFLSDVSIFGHFHDGFPGGAIRYGDKICINPGALARERATKPNLTRQIQLGFLAVEDDGKVGYCNVIVPHEPADKVFDLNKRNQTIASKQNVEQFVAQFSADVNAVAEVDLSSIEEVNSLVKQLQLDQTTESETLKFLAEANDEIKT